MDIKDFSDLSDFSYNEYMKMLETFGIKKVPDKTIKFSEKNIKKYLKLYEKPLFKQERILMKIKIAIATEPHSKLWKFFHSDLQQKIDAYKQEKLQKDSNTSENQPEKVYTSAVPVIISNISRPQENNLEPQENSELDDNFDF